MRSGTSLLGAMVRVAIVGPTGAGKTALVAAAREAGLLDDTSVVSADAFAVYRGLEVTSWAPRVDERLGIDYRLVGQVPLEREVSLGWFLRELALIEAGSGSVLLVGGTSLWVRAAVNGVEPPPPAEGLRRWLEGRARVPEGVAGLSRILAGADPVAAAGIDGPNPRRIVRALEVALGSGRSMSVHGDGLDPSRPARYVQVGLEVPESQLRSRLEARIDAQLAAGWLEEVERALPVASRTARAAIGLSELARVLAGELSLVEARREILRRTWRLVRRQLAWLKRDERVRWCRSVEEALDALRASRVEKTVRA